MTCAVLPPGSTIGVIGGGQLGRMMTTAAHDLGYRVVVLTGGDQHTPTGQVADLEVAAGFNDSDALEAFSSEADVVTWEFENVDTSVADVAARSGIAVRPSAAIIRSSQDRECEKLALEAAGVPVAPWRRATSESELAAAVAELNAPVIAKTARFGYDGKGQRRIDSDETIGEAWRDLGGARLVVESVIEFDMEVSVVIARGADGSTAHHGVMHNEHVDHILDLSVTPAPLSDEMSRECIALATRIAESLELVGVMCVEMFVIGEKLLVNEVAPRPHNSGHLTIEAASASQFEQQVRAVCGLPLGDGSCRPAAMAQLLGRMWSNGEPDWSSVLDRPDIELHLYGKAEPRPQRKMGHLTCVADDPQTAMREVLAARDSLDPR